MPAPPITGTARLLGFAGLLPQIGALLLIASGIDAALGALVAFCYAAMILSFLGGIWWGLALHRERGQAGIAAIAVTPPLLAFGLVLLRFGGLAVGWLLVATGSALLLTLLVDRRLEQEGDAPPGWLGLRVPLSAGLGGLTILAGALAPHAISITYSN